MRRQNGCVAQSVSDGEPISPLSLPRPASSKARYLVHTRLDPALLPRIPNLPQQSLGRRLCWLQLVWILVVQPVTIRILHNSDVINKIKARFEFRFESWL